jgi:hypothetical protein
MQPSKEATHERSDIAQANEIGTIVLYCNTLHKMELIWDLDCTVLLHCFSVELSSNTTYGVSIRRHNDSRIQVQYY